MKRLGSAALLSLLSTLSVVGLVGLVACENSSRLDSSAKNVPKEKADKPAAAFKGDHSGSLEDRVARLEANYDKNAEAFDFLAKVYDQQKAQQQRAQREEPDPDAVFAVVEGWDFA
jgi:predicted lipid-binding transport protein (Tim44 family)